MRAVIPSQGHPFTVSFTLSSTTAQRIRIVAWDIKKYFTKYYDRQVNMTTVPRNFYMNFPMYPDMLALRISSVQADAANMSDSSLKATNVLYKTLNTRPVSLTRDSDLFGKFAKKFAKQAGYCPPGTYHSDCGKFTIIYKKELTNRAGQPVNTPAHIGQDTRIIGVSQDKFKPMSVPARYVVLRHEFDHMYINPAIGQPVDNEMAADIPAAYVSLCEGFPPIEIRQAFAHVFVGADNQMNQRRMAIIEDFITRFEKGKIK